MEYVIATLAIVAFGVFVYSRVRKARKSKGGSGGPSNPGDSDAEQK